MTPNTRVYAWCVPLWKRSGGQQSVGLEDIRDSSLVPEILKCPLCRKLLQDGVWVQSCDKVRLESVLKSCRWVVDESVDDLRETLGADLGADLVVQMGCEACVRRCLSANGNRCPFGPRLCQKDPHHTVTPDQVQERSLAFWIPSE